MIIKRIIPFLLALALAPLCLGQSFPKWEYYAGYSQTRVKSTVDSVSFVSPGGPGGYTNLCSTATGEMLGQNSQKFFCDGRGFNGFDLSATYNLTRYIGITGNVARGTKSDRYVDDFGGVIQTIDADDHLYSVLAGVRLKDNAGVGRLRPFAHALAGLSRYSSRQRQTIDAFPEFNFVAEDRDTSFTMKLGAGLDVNVGPHIDLRVIEIDYQPVFAGDRGLDTVSGPFTFQVKGRTAQNYTVGFGVVIH